MNNTNLCSRKACNNFLEYGYYNIKNDNTFGGRDYCIKCGRKIIDLNPSIEYHLFNEKGEVVAGQE